MTLALERRLEKLERVQEAHEHGRVIVYDSPEDLECKRTAALAAGVERVVCIPGNRRDHEPAK